MRISQYRIYFLEEQVMIDREDEENVTCFTPQTDYDRSRL